MSWKVRREEESTGGSEGETCGSTIGRHLREAYGSFRGERQLADYVARLDLGDCMRIVAASRRVPADEKRSFAEVIRTRTLHALSGLEGG